MGFFLKKSITMSQRTQFENTCQQLVGKTLGKVEYEEIAYDQSNQITPAQPYYTTRLANVHSLDYAVWLHTTQQDKIEITWDASFYPYGIGVKINQAPSTNDSQKWDVSAHQLWKDCLHGTIQQVKLIWEQVSGNSYPQTLIITFANEQQILIGAAQFLNSHDQKVFGMSDNLIVTNDVALAKTINMISQI
ncbi:hypothetical protein M23134_01643 [Microscilla marina ATCC 23134]|uniref:Uncharacterized protein n=2 Tax=Microscilla marina TaxID=1027 RepID=A2A071_MICM2|nr:hypothetical protein M23134_01643 [Microscilla marina ATCC 23134]